METQRQIVMLSITIGYFSYICTLLGIIGTKFKDIGPEEFCLEASVVASWSIAGVMTGQKYNAAILVHKLWYKALIHLIWKGFLAWIETVQGDVQDGDNTI